MALLELLILIFVIRLVTRRGGFDPNPYNYSSNPVVGVAIGNAANRNFENSQCLVGGCSNDTMAQAMGNNYGYYTSPSTPPHPFPQNTNRGSGIGGMSNRKKGFYKDSLLNMLSSETCGVNTSFKENSPEMQYFEQY